MKPLFARDGADAPGAEFEAPARPWSRTPSGETLAHVLEVFLREAHLDVDFRSIHEAVARAERDEGGPLAPGSGRIVLLGRELGLRLTNAQWTLREAASRAMKGHSIAVRGLREEGPAWVLVQEGSWRRVRAAVPEEGGLAEPQNFTYGDLASLLGGQGPGDRLHVLTSQPLLPWEGRPSETAGADGHGAPPSPLTRLFRLMRPEREDLWKILLFSAASGTLNLATPLAVDSVVNQVAFGSLPYPLLFLVLAFFVALALSAMMRGVQYFLSELIQRRLFLRMATDIAYRLPRVRREAFEREHAPEIVNKFFAVLTLQKTAATILLDGINVILAGTIGMVILGFYHPALLVFDVFLILSVAVILFVLGRGAVRTAIEETETKYRAVGWLEELGRRTLTFKNPYAAEFALAQGDRATQVYLAARGRHFQIVMRQTIGALALQALGSVALLAVGGQLVIDGTLTLGQLVAAELIVTLVLSSVSKLSKQLEAWYEILAAVNKLGHLVDLPLEREGGEIGGGDARGITLEMENVHFGFPGFKVLTNASLRVKPCERIGIYSARADGTSTLLEILYGLREPDEGKVTIDGVDLRHWRLDALRADAVLVHDDEIVKGTILENVIMGRPRVRYNDVKGALTAVGLWDLVMALEDGVHTVLLSDGAPLSATARLRVTLARALVGRPRLLLLDGVLDRLRVQDRLRAIEAVFDARYAGSVVVASRDPEVLRRCDRIFEIVDGRLVPHDKNELPRGGAPGDAPMVR